MLHISPKLQQWLHFACRCVIPRLTRLWRLQGPDMTNPCCKVWLDGAKAIPADDRPDRPPGCNLVSPLLPFYIILYI